MNTWTAEEKSRILQQCKNILNNVRKIVCFYANPKLPQMLGMQSLNALTKEMRDIIHKFSPIHYHLEPATTQENMKDALQRYEPDVISLSTHAFHNQIVLETQDGRPDLMNEVAFTKMILESTTENPPSCILLLACDTKSIAQTLSKSFPKACIIFWISNKVEDTAAQFFTQTFFEKLSIIMNQKQNISSDDYVKCWKHSVEMFSDQFEIQDPQEFIKHGVNPPRNVRGIPAYIINGEIQEAKNTSPSTPANTKQILYDNDNLQKQNIKHEHTDRATHIKKTLFNT